MFEETKGDSYVKRQNSVREKSLSKYPVKKSQECQHQIQRNLDSRSCGRQPDLTGKQTPSLFDRRLEGRMNVEFSQ